jgi:AcrR family transcriptional regulator
MVESRRDSLIAAAAALLDQGGPAAVTLREVGRTAGVSHNAPYKHFADKDALLAAVAGRELDQLARVARARADATPQPSAKALMTGYVAWALRYPERFKLTFGRWTREEPELAATAAAAHSMLLSAVATAQAQGDLPPGDPERLAGLLQALAHGAADLALSGHLSESGKGRAGPADLVADLFDYLRLAAAEKASQAPVSIGAAGSRHHSDSEPS